MLCWQSDHWWRRVYGFVFRTDIDIRTNDFCGDSGDFGIYTKGRPPVPEANRAEQKGSSPCSVIGGLIGLLGGGIGMVLGGVTGALLGDAKDADNKHLSQELIAQVAERMEEGDMGLLMTVNETDESILDHMLLKYNNKNVYRFDAEAIAKEADAARQQAEQKED